MGSAVKAIERDFAENALDYGRKLYLIENCIYGVDIQPIAIQISKLRFFISLVCDQKTNRDKAKNHGIRPLPNLETKFVAADTLIKLEKTQADLFFDPKVKLLEKELEAVRHRYFSAQTRQQKMTLQKKDNALRTEIGDLLHDSGLFDSEEYSHKVAGWNPYDHYSVADFFDPEWMFGRSLANGFDIVIGNPPYGAEFSSEQRALLLRDYKYQSNPPESYMLFVEKGYNLNRKSGVLSYIVPNTWLQSLTFQKFRRFLTSQLQWRSLLVVQTKVFAAVVDTNIFIFEKKPPTKGGLIPIFFFEPTGLSLEHRLLWDEIPKNGDAINIVFPPSHQKLFHKIKQNGLPLKNIANVFNGVKPFEKGKGKPPQTAQIMRDKPFVVEGSKPTGAHWMPLLRGSLIHRYVTVWNEDSWIKYGEWLAAPRDPTIFEAPVKLFVRQTGDSIIATIGRSGFVARNNLHIILPKRTTNLLFVLGVLNSKAMDFAYCFINPEKGEALAEVKKNHVEELPLPKTAIVEPLRQKAIIGLVDQILSEKQLNSTADTSALERGIDELVYKLYGLTPEEIKIVEEFTN